MPRSPQREPGPQQHANATGPAGGGLRRLGQPLLLLLLLLFTPPPAALARPEGDGKEAGRQAGRRWSGAKAAVNASVRPPHGGDSRRAAGAAVRGKEGGVPSWD